MPDTRLRTSFAHFSHITMAGETEARRFWKSSISAKLDSVWAACLCSSLSSSSPRRQQATTPSSWSFPTFGSYLPSHPFLTSSFPSSSFFLSLFPFLFPSQPFFFPWPTLRTSHLLCSWDSLEILIHGPLPVQCLHHRHLSSHPISTIGDRIQAAC